MIVCWFVGSSHLHALGQLGAAAPQPVHLRGHQVLQLVLHLVVRDDLLPQSTLEDLTHHQPAQLRLPPRRHPVAEELVEVLQLEGVLLALLHPLLQVLQPLRQLSEVQRVLAEKRLLERGVLLHEVPTDGFGHVDVLLEPVVNVLKLLQNASPVCSQASHVPASRRNWAFLSDALT